MTNEFDPDVVAALTSETPSKKKTRRRKRKPSRQAVARKNGSD